MVMVFSKLWMRNLSWGCKSFCQMFLRMCLLHTYIILVSMGFDNHLPDLESQIYGYGWGKKYKKW